MPIMRDGEPLMKKMPVKSEDLEMVNDLYSGIIIPVEVHLPHPEEKESKKKRRLFVAKRINFLSSYCPLFLLIVVYFLLNLIH